MPMSYVPRDGALAVAKFLVPGSAAVEQQVTDFLCSRAGTVRADLHHLIRRRRACRGQA